MYIAIEMTNSLMEKLDEIIDYAGKNYGYLSAALYGAYISLFLGIVAVNPTYINELKIFMQTVVCLILILRFNPLRKHELKQYDANIIFSSAIFLLINTGIAETFDRYWAKLPIPDIYEDKI